jgi:hypothetical protein
VVGTFGDGYFQKGNRGSNPFATHIPQYLPNIHQMNAEVRGTWDMSGKPVEDLIAWFVHESSAPTDVLKGTDTQDQSRADHNVSNASNQDSPPNVGWSGEIHRMVQKSGSSLNTSTNKNVEEAS